MRRRINFIAAAFILSFCLHLFALYSFFVYISTKATPVFYSWFDIARKQDSLLKNKSITFTDGVNFSASQPYKEYFVSFIPLNKPAADIFTQKPEILPQVAKDVSMKDFNRIETVYFYLWERPGGLSHKEEERATYKVYVSAHGKIIFSFPEKLPLDSYGNLSLQEYIRESAVFLGDKFCWTKLEGIVK
jgi:hypothetical protein